MQMDLIRNNTMIDVSVHINDLGRGNEETKSDDSVHTDDDFDDYKPYKTESYVEMNEMGQSNQQAYIESDEDEDERGKHNRRKLYSPTGSCELESLEEDLRDENGDDDSEEVIHGLSRDYDYNMDETKDEDTKPPV